MSTEEKLKLLTKMIEHPEDYSEQEKDDTLQDEGCRELYDMLVETSQAMTTTLTDEEMGMPDVDKEWTRFQASRHPRKTLFRFIPRNIAAACITLLCISGIAFATVKMVQHYNKVENEQTVEVVNNESPKTKVDKTKAAPAVEAKDSVPTIYENVELQTILSDLADTYNVQVEYQQEQSRHIRLYLQLKREDGLEGAIKMLNHFEKVSIKKENDKLIVE
jgi:hypothetical protein